MAQHSMSLNINSASANIGRFSSPGSTMRLAMNTFAMPQQSPAIYPSVIPSSIPSLSPSPSSSARPRPSPSPSVSPISPPQRSAPAIQTAGLVNALPDNVIDLN